MKKFGFTLAEALVAMAILGVVATLTMPMLQTNVLRSQIGPALAKAVNTLENANKLILQDANARSLDVACNLDNARGYIACLSNFITGTVTETSIPSSHTSGNVHTLISKDGISYSLLSYTNVKDYGNGINNSDSASSRYGGRYFNIQIDINGNRAPNMTGRDQFDFIVDSYGSVIANGSREYLQYMGDNFGGWETECNRNTVSQGGFLSTSCAGSVVDNNYTVIYKF